MADEIDYKLIGDDLQGVIITLDPGEAVVAEAGGMMYMQDGIRMATSLDMTGRGGGLSCTDTGSIYPERGKSRGRSSGWRTKSRSGAPGRAHEECCARCSYERSRTCELRGLLTWIDSERSLADQGLIDSARTGTTIVSGSLI